MMRRGVWEFNWPRSAKIDETLDVHMLTKPQRSKSRKKGEGGQVLDIRGGRKG